MDLMKKAEAAEKSKSKCESEGDVPLASNSSNMNNVDLVKAVENAASVGSDTQV